MESNQLKKISSLLQTASDALADASLLLAEIAEGQCMLRSEGALEEEPGVEAHTPADIALSLQQLDGSQNRFLELVALGAARPMKGVLSPEDEKLVEEMRAELLSPATLSPSDGPAQTSDEQSLPVSDGQKSAS